MILWILVALAAIGATALFIFRPPANPLGVTGKPFAIETTAGQRFTEADLRGTPSLVFFGYTHCPDVCPTTLAETQLWKEELGLTGKDLRILFVTVDPARDTPEVLSSYLSSFPDVTGLVGTAEQTEAIKASFGAQSENTAPDASGYYLVNHTASVYLLDRNGRFVSTIAYGEDKATAVGKLKRLIGA